MKNKLFVILLSVFCLNTAHAQIGGYDSYRPDTYSFKEKLTNGYETMKVKVKTRFSFSEWKYVKTVKIKIKNLDDGVVYKDKFRIEVNGSYRSPVRIDQGYAIYDVNEPIREVCLENLGDRDYDLEDLYCDVIAHRIDLAVGIFGGSMYSNRAKELIDAIADLTWILNRKVVAEDDILYLRPIRNQAVDCWGDMATNTGMGETSSCLLKLIATIEFSKDFIVQQLNIADSRESATLFLTAEKALKRML